MKSWKKNLILILSVGLLLLLGGCSSSGILTADTTLVADRSFQGERQMTITLTSREFKKLFDSDSDQLEAFLTEQTPDTLEWSIQLSDDGSVSLLFVLDFDSYEEYCEKIESLLEQDAVSDAGETRTDTDTDTDTNSSEDSSQTAAEDVGDTAADDTADDTSDDAGTAAALDAADEAELAAAEDTADDTGTVSAEADALQASEDASVTSEDIQDAAEAALAASEDTDEDTASDATLVSSDDITLVTSEDTEETKAEDSSESGSDSMEVSVSGSASVYFEYEDSIFKQGYVLEENFTSADLLSWLIEETEDSSSSLSSYATAIEAGETLLIFEEEETVCEEMISASNMQSNALESITATLELNEDDSFTAVIDYEASASVTALLGQELVELMAELVPEGGSIQTKTTKDGTVFTISFSALSTEDFVAMLNQVLVSDSSVFVISEDTSDSETLKGQKKLEVYLDGAYFLDLTSSDTVMTYIIEVPEDYTPDDCEGMYGYLIDSTYAYADDLCILTFTSSPSEYVTLSLGYSVDVEKVEVSTIMNSRISYTRNISFTLTKSQYESFGDRLEERIKDRLTEDITYVKQESDDGGIVYTVTFTADSTQTISELTCTFLDGDSASGGSLLSGGKSTENRLRKITYGYSDLIDLSTFLSGSELANGLYYSFTYPSGFTGSFVQSSNYESVSEDGSVISCVTYNKVIEVSSSGTTLNLEGILVQGAFFISLVVILGILILHMGGIVRCIRKKVFDPGELDLYSRQGYRYVTLFVICVVICAITFVRLFFGVY